MVVPVVLLAAASTTPGPSPSPPTEIDAEGAVADTNDEHTSDSRIVGGSTIDISDAPYQAFIADVDLASGRFTAFCGGSIYQTQWVITAAHCVERATTWPFGRLRVGVGTSDLTSVPLSRLRAVSDIIIHPGWNASTFQNDIALLRLSEPVPIEAGCVESVSLPISLPATWPSTGTTGRVAGWGLVRHGTDQASSVLQNATVRVLTEIGDPDCGRYGDYDSLYRAESMLCAGVPEAAVGVCRGDSGGGLVVPIGAVRYLAGITSWSIGCGGEFNDGTQTIFDDWPGVYTRASVFVDWIRSTTATAPPPPPPFDPDRPSRIYDTREFGARLAPGQIAVVALPSELRDASAAVVNVTATNASDDGYFTVFACGSERPTTSNGNFVGVSTIANNVIAPIGLNHSICVKTSQGAADIIVDLFAFYSDTDQYTALTPARVADTRLDGDSAGHLPPGTTLTVPLPASVPNDAAAVALNVTATNALGDGYVTVYPCGQAVPTTSNVNYVGITTVANNVVTAIGTDRAVCIRTGQAAANILVDLMGYYPATGSTTARAPTRVFDSRAGTGRINAGATVPVALDGWVPTDATTALLNVTVANADADGYVTVAPCGQAMPTTSNANFVGITTIANNVISAIGSDRSICIRPSQAAADIIVDLVGVATD